MGNNDKQWCGIDYSVTNEETPYLGNRYICISEKHEVSMAHIDQFFFICLFVLPLLWFTIKSRSLNCQNLATLTKKALPFKYLKYGLKRFSLNMGTTQGIRDRQGRPILPAQVTNQKTLWLILMRWKDLARGLYWWPVPVTGQSDWPTTSTFLLPFFFFTFFVNVHLRFELIFFFKGKISYLTALNYCNIVSNDRAVPCMCLGSCLH